MHWQRESTKSFFLPIFLGLSVGVAFASPARPQLNPAVISHSQIPSTQDTQFQNRAVVRRNNLQQKESDEDISNHDHTQHSIARSTTATFDIVIYDATAGGIAAAVSASRADDQLSIALVCASWPGCFEEGGFVIGGMTGSGLSATDTSHDPTDTIGGFAKEFYQRNFQHYFPEGTVHGNNSGVECLLPNLNCSVTYNLEPSVAQEIFLDMLGECKNVQLIFGQQVIAISKNSNHITSITTTSSSSSSSTTTTTTTTYTASVFIDASYEGDLMALALSPSHVIVGRESRTTYNESLAGVQYTTGSHKPDLPISPYVASNGTSGPLLPFIEGSDVDPGRPGEGDTKVPSYNFRLCVTKNVTNQVPFPRPSTYNADDWELLRRYINACSKLNQQQQQQQQYPFENREIDSNASSPLASLTRSASCQIAYPSCNLVKVPSGKFDMNNCGAVSSDMIGGSWKYPEASFDDRKEIWRAHRDYVQGLLWTMLTDPNIPGSVKTEMSQWGLCRDEFELSNNWPPWLYIREARRMVSDQVFTQNTVGVQQSGKGIGNFSIGVGGYNFDSHNVQRFKCDNETACFGAKPADQAPTGPYFWNEGDVETAPGKYQIPYWIMLPPESEASNLLVAASPSASHIGVSTLRMEPQFMTLGQAAGTAAVVALEFSSSVQKIPLDRFNALLVKGDALLDCQVCHK